MALLGEVLELMAQTPVYNHRPLNQLVPYIVLPVQLGQSKTYRNREDGRLLGFVTWAWFSPEKAKEWQKMPREPLLSSEDWNNGKELWFIDLLAPYGGAHFIVRDLSKTFKNVKVGHSTRSFGTGQVKKVGRYHNVLCSQT